MLKPTKLIVTINLAKNNINGVSVKQRKFRSTNKRDCVKCSYLS